jgi:hypothetical protein
MIDPTAREKMTDLQIYIAELGESLGMKYSHCSDEHIEDSWVCMMDGEHQNVKQIFYCKDITEPYFTERVGNFLMTMGRVRHLYELERMINPLHNY